jgi:hypothetical protein
MEPVHNVVLDAPDRCRVQTLAVLELKHALEFELSQARRDAIAVDPEKVGLVGLIDRYLSSSNGSDRMEVLEDMAKELWAYWEEYDDHTALKACMEIESEVLDLCPAGHPERAFSCTNLAVTLKTCYEQMGDHALLKQAIELQQEALDLRPPGHPDRAISCANLAASLLNQYEQTKDNAMLDQAINLERESLTLRPAGHPDRATSCDNLAVSLRVCYGQTGNNAMLDEAIKLQREALDLRPLGHKDRAISCGNLAVSLSTLFNQTGDGALLNEAIELEREALLLRPAGNPDHMISCTNLAISLKVSYERTGNSALLDQAIKLQWEALDLCPPGHPDHAMSSANLAVSISARYSHTGDNALLDQAVKLQYEALDRCPADHLDRALLCLSLANSLKASFKHTRDHRVLDRAIELQREALVLIPAGHPDRSMACGNLAFSLTTRYKQTGDNTLLEQAITLEQEALELCPTGHPDRGLSCGNLAESLIMRFEQTATRELVDQAIELELEALVLTPEGYPARWRYLWGMARLTQLLPPPVDQEIIMDYLHQAFNASSYDDISLVIVGAGETLLGIDASTMPRQQKLTLINLYSSALHIVALAAGLALNTSTQLRHIGHSSSLGPKAFSLAIQLDELPSGLQLLERARGVLWSQMLHIRDPQLERVPDELAEKLRGLVNSTPASEMPIPSIPSDHTGPEYSRRSKLQDVIRQIRSLPGLSDFMGGPTIEALLRTAACSFVVVLVAGETSCNALILAPSSGAPILVALPDITRRTLQKLAFIVLTSAKRGVAAEFHRDDRFMKGIQDGMLESNARLAKVWHAVVKPVITQLGLSVSICSREPSVHG